MYETGDDQIKRTIAESWSKANQEKAFKDWNYTLCF
jgi:hypothetical protein